MTSVDCCRALLLKGEARDGHTLHPVWGEEDFLKGQQVWEQARLLMEVIL